MGNIASDLIALAGDVMEDTTANREDPKEEDIPGTELCGDEAHQISLEATKRKLNRIMWFNLPDGVLIRAQSHTDCAIAAENDQYCTFVSKP